MRKDLRYGLGIGALALLFVITFLVVRNNSRNTDGESQVLADSTIDSTNASPEANPSPPILAETTGTNTTLMLPPLPTGSGSMAPLPGSVTRGVSKADPFDPRPAGPPKAAATQDWDNILSSGRIGGGASVAAKPPPTVRSTPPIANLGSTTSVVPPPPIAPRVAPQRESVVSPRPLPTVGNAGTLSAVTGRPYTVREGDTFVSIAKTTYGQSKYFMEIEKANPSVDPTRLQPGQVIILPDLGPAARAAKPATRGPYNASDDNRPINPKTEYRVETGDSLHRISTRLYGTHRMSDAIYNANRDAIGPNPAKLRFGMILKLPQLADGK